MAKIVIGITGSIAAYKSLEIIRLLKKAGHEVKVILTTSALNFVTKTSILAFNCDVYTDQDTYNSKEDIMQHINLAKWPDLIVIAPLSADTLSKIVSGFAGNLLTSTILATKAKTLLVPAMNMEMWSNSIIQENTLKLKQHNYTFLGPASGIQACGDNGLGRMIEPYEIFKYITHYSLAKEKNNEVKLQGKKVVITLGATIEAIDPVRYISNNSSGKMGLELAYAFAVYGADVTIIAGNVSVAMPSTIATIKVKNADEMYIESSKLSASADVFIACAAVSDYKVANYAIHKIKKTTDDNLSLKLVKNIDIVTTIKNNFPKLFVVGFAAETENLLEYAKNKLIAKNLDMIIANDVSNNKVFASNMTNVTIITHNIPHPIPINTTEKAMVAHDIVAIISSDTWIKNLSATNLGYKNSNGNYHRQQV